MRVHLQMFRCVKRGSEDNESKIDSKMGGEEGWLGQKDSNLRLAAPKAAVLPLDDAPIPNPFDPLILSILFITIRSFLSLLPFLFEWIPSVHGHGYGWNRI